MWLITVIPRQKLTVTCNTTLNSELWAVLFNLEKYNVLCVFNLRFSQNHLTLTDWPKRTSPFITCILLCLVPDYFILSNTSQFYLSRENLSGCRPLHAYCICPSLFLNSFPPRHAWPNRPLCCFSLSNATCRRFYSSREKLLKWNTKLDQIKYLYCMHCGGVSVTRNWLKG